MLTISKLVATGGAAFMLLLGSALGGGRMSQASPGDGSTLGTMPWETKENRNLLFYKPFAQALSWRTLEVKSVDSWKASTGQAVKALDQEIGRFKTKGTGFYKTAHHRNRWWLIDPDGKLFLSAGVNGIKVSVEDAEFKGKFRNEHYWAQSEQTRLKEWGFNTAGQESDAQFIRDHADGLAFTVTRWPGWTKEVGPLEAFRQDKVPGASRPRARHREMVMPVFHPEFESFVLKHAPSLAGFAKERNLLGYYLDRDLPYPKLQAYLAASGSELHRGAREAAVAWLEKRGKQPQDYGTADEEEWPGYVFSQYCKKIVPAMRRYDPNHLVLGPRLSSKCLQSLSVMKAVGELCDVVAVQPKARPVPASSELASWHQMAGKPILVAQMSAELPSSRPGPQEQVRGWIVPDQSQKGRYYEAFVMECLQSRACVGWHWQQYQDQGGQQPETGDVTNRYSPASLGAGAAVVSNGVISAGFQAHHDCVDRMKDINLAMYAVAASGLPPEPDLGGRYWPTLLVMVVLAAAAFVAQAFMRRRSASTTRL